MPKTFTNLENIKKAGFMKINHIFARPAFRFQIFNS